MRKPLFGARASDAELGGLLACASYEIVVSYFLPSSALDNSPSQASADIGNASIDYVRNGRHVEIRIAGKIDEIRVPAARTADAVQAACERELDQMQREFRDLQARLVPQLSVTGHDPMIRPGMTNWDESRNWSVEADRRLTIAPSEYETVVRIGLETPQVSDAAVAQQAVANELRNRETAIRAVYAQILDDLGVS